MYASRVARAPRSPHRRSRAPERDGRASVRALHRRHGDRARARSRACAVAVRSRARSRGAGWTKRSRLSSSHGVHIAISIRINSQSFLCATVDHGAVPFAPDAASVVFFPCGTSLRFILHARIVLDAVASCGRSSVVPCGRIAIPCGRRRSSAVLDAFDSFDGQSDRISMHSMHSKRSIGHRSRMHSMHSMRRSVVLDAFDAFDRRRSSVVHRMHSIRPMVIRSLLDAFDAFVTLEANSSRRRARPVVDRRSIVRRARSSFATRLARASARR